MKVKELIEQLQRFNGEQQVAIYNRATGGALWIPNYDPEIQVAPDPDFASEFELPPDTVFILGK